jgi:glutathione synthase
VIFNARTTRHLRKTGAYRNGDGHLDPVAPCSFPTNRAIEHLSSGLATAHGTYGPPRSKSATRTGILFIVQKNEYNVCDQRHLEYALWAKEPPVPVYRVALEDVLTVTSLTSSRELLYHSHSCVSSPLEISVVYLRAGCDPDEYDSDMCAARLHLERSRAIKCPSILSQLTTLKKVQQALSFPGALLRFLSEDSAARISKTFVPLYPLDDTALGQFARSIALNPIAATRYVLKPPLEGGGHNHYRENIPKFLGSVSPSLWPTFILMELIQPPTHDNIIVFKDKVYSGPVVSEIGIFGVCIWRSGGHGAELLENFEAGWLFRSKRNESDEGGITVGTGCHDSPCLVDV